MLIRVLASVLASWLCACLPSVAEGQVDLPYIPPPVGPPPPTVDICPEISVEGHHYELDEDCLDAAFDQYRLGRNAAYAAEAAAIEAAHAAYEVDVEHADEQRDDCIEAAGGDAQGIAECEAWHDIEVGSAASTRDSAILSAKNARKATMRDVLAQLEEDRKECCVLVADEEHLAPVEFPLKPSEAISMRLSEREFQNGLLQLSFLVSPSPRPVGLLPSLESNESTRSVQRPRLDPRRPSQWSVRVESHEEDRWKTMGPRHSAS